MLEIEWVGETEPGNVRELENVIERNIDSVLQLTKGKIGEGNESAILLDLPPSTHIYIWVFNIKVITEKIIPTDNIIDPSGRSTG